MDTFAKEAYTKLKELREEWDAGQKMLVQLDAKQQELEQKRKDLQQMMLRISGAIQVLEEILPDAEEQ
ncbi:hypothetical protein [Candidatus Uabimicrobium amorphum]|uniref:Uncharacterized protein n=1 Tax=Uabimicrobium amorphum TaxID=2596890 RepID=A0A5S9IWU7_UABAM|nr:hypothetical protein [Candidatus Uabimicrobium amorphum]BBM87985.1 hypothetical protein UABAM_06401 [Candidatus Uabimicrobium amorphum]